MAESHDDAGAFARFKAEVQKALRHLYDPNYRAPQLLEVLVGRGGDQERISLQQAMVSAIEALRPPPSVPQTARARRVYDLLAQRYLHGLTQEETAERLGVTTRHLRREQAAAVEALALHIWEARQAADVTEATALDTAVSGAPLDAPSQDHPPTWRMQLQQEVQSLRQAAPHATANVAEAMAGAMKVAAVMGERHGVAVSAEPVPAELCVAVHPLALRLALTRAISQLAASMSSGSITLQTEAGDRMIAISLRASPVPPVPIATALVDELLGPLGSAEVRSEGDAVVLRLRLPTVDRVVMVVDDNDEIVHVFRRYTTGTRYRIERLARGRDALPTELASLPDILVIDVMLPDIDGWELLTRLHEHPRTAHVPVVVCSVIRDEELALALGAAGFIPKPVYRHQFLQSLDRALRWAEARSRVS